MKGKKGFQKEHKINLGRKKSEIEKENSRVFMLGNKNALGHKVSKDSRMKISQKNKGNHHTEKTKKQISESKKGISTKLWARFGENNHRWIKDRTKLKIDERRKAYDTQYKYWMLEVKKRDNWKCKINNKDCGGRLEAHHILSWKDSPELRYNINNGIALCHSHHPRKREEEKRLSPYFKELVSVSEV